MAEKLGIEFIKKAVQWGLVTGKKIAGLVKDESPVIGYFQLFPELSAIPEIVKSAPQMLAELKDYSLEERAEIRDVVRAEFPEAKDDAIEEAIENALDAVAANYKLATSQIFSKAAVN